MCIRDRPGTGRLLSMMTAAATRAVAAAGARALRAEGAGTRIVSHGLFAALFTNGLFALFDGTKHLETVAAFGTFPSVQRHKRRLRMFAI